MSVGEKSVALPSEISSAIEAARAAVPAGPGEKIEAEKGELSVVELERIAAQERARQSAIARDAVADVVTGRQQLLTLGGIVDLHRDALMAGDEKAASCYVGILKIVSLMLRFPLMGENCAADVLEGLTRAQQRLKYLEERAEARRYRSGAEGDNAKARAGAVADIHARRDREQARLDGLRLNAANGDDDLNEIAVQPRMSKGQNANDRALSPEQIAAEERTSRARAKEMQAERDGREAANQEEQRKRMGFDDEDAQGGSQLHDDMQAQAMLEAQGRLAARRQQRAKDVGEIGAAGPEREVPFEETVARAHTPALNMGGLIGGNRR